MARVPCNDFLAAHAGLCMTVGASAGCLAGGAGVQSRRVRRSCDRSDAFETALDVCHHLVHPNKHAYMLGAVKEQR